MPIFNEGIHTQAQVKAGLNIVRITGLKSGTLYAVLVKGRIGARFTDVKGALTQGSGYSTIKPLSAAATTLQGRIQSDHGVAAPASYFVAGADANTNRYLPQLSVDYANTTPTSVAVRVAAPDFNSPLDANIAAFRCRISRDGGSTYPEFTEVTAPFPDGACYATFNVQVPYDSNIYAIWQTRFKDGTFGKQTRPLNLYGARRPDVLPLAAPRIGTIAGAYVCEAGKVSLTVDVPCEADPQATDIQVQLLNGSTVIATGMATNVAGSSVTVRITGVDSSIPTYTVNAYSVQSGSRGVVATTTWTTSTATQYKPAAFSTAGINLTEVIERQDGKLQSKIKVSFGTQITADKPKGNIYIRKKDGKAQASLLKSDFVLSGSSAGDFTTGVINDAGASVVYQVVVLSVAPNGIEADFSTDQVKEVNVFQYANYIPPQQSVPTITILDERTVRIDGTYTRIADSPEPIEVRAYKSETNVTSAYMVSRAPYVRSTTTGAYTYSLIITDLTPYSVGSGNSDITIRTYLENGGLTNDASKTTMRVTQAIPAAPVLGSALAYVKTVRATVTNAAVANFGAQTTHTPSTGNGGKVTITAAANVLKVEVSDGGGTPGTNPEVILPSTDVNGSAAYMVFTPSINAGTRNVRAKWVSSFGDSAWGNAIQVTFPVDNAVDSTCDISASAPRFVCNADGTVSITWAAGNFGTTKLGSYIIRRSKVNTATTSVVVGNVTKADILTWTDALPLEAQETTYYYWLEATNAQGFSSASPLPVKIQSGNAYAAETVVAAASHRTVAPATPTGLTVTGSQGGFLVRWDSVPRVMDYVLEFSAAGTFADTVTYYLTGTSFFQVAGSTAAKATADNYRWRIKARDYSNTLSTVSTAVAPDNTAFASMQDSAPAAPAAPTLVANTDGSITLTLTATAAPYFHIKRLSSATSWTPATSGTADNAKLEAEHIIDGTATTFRDTGLNPARFYTYQVFSRSKLGTDSTTFAAPPSPVQVQYVVKGIMRPNLITNGHFGTAFGAYGTSSAGWTLAAGTTLIGQGSFTYSGTSFNTPSFSNTGTATKIVSQVIQVIPGKTYTVMGILYGLASGAGGGRSYIRINPAVTPTISGTGTPPAPYNALGSISNGVDYTQSNDVYCFVTYSFVAPSNTTQVTLEIGWESRSQSTATSCYPQFVQVFLDE